MTEQRCCTEMLFDPKTHERALMGPAHAISGSGAAVLVIGLLFWFGSPLFAVLFGASVSLIVLFVAVATGSALVPDLDNSRSTVRSSLGVVGVAGSVVFRSTSRIIQTVVRTKRDDPTPDPHRGFWHTIVGALLLGFLAWLATLPTTEIPIADGIAVGDALKFVITATMIHLCLAGVAKKSVKKLKDIPIVGEIAAFIASVILTGVLLFISPDEPSLWLPVAISFGCIMHILGDALTTAGVPIWFPLTGFVKGKFWWTTRFAKFKADNEGLNSTIYGLSILAMVAGIGLMVIRLAIG